METLFLVLLIVGLFCTGLILAGILLISRWIALIPEVLARVSNTEQLVIQLSTDGHSTSEVSPELWRTADGKYTASSFEELLSKMASDPDSPLTTDEINAIKSVFKKIMQEDLDEDDTPPEPWKS